MKRTLGLLVFLAACGTNGSAADDFIGTWTYNAGSTSTLDCPDNSLDNTTMETGTFQIAEGTTSDFIVVPQSGDKCPAQKFDVSGKVATIVTGQVCMYTENTTNGTVMVSGAYATGTYTLSADKKTVSGSQTGSVTFTGSAATITCSVSGSVSATKVGN
ncbi:MAG: hypothetical protein IPQ07_04620 [Myxococcales bacterium]|nr:hypothetical protein [Myxococcales bacterium]